MSFCVIENRLTYSISGILQECCLGERLYAIGRPRKAIRIRPTLLDIYRADVPVFALDSIDHRDQTKPVGLDSHRRHVLENRREFWVRKGTFASITSAVSEPALFGVGAVGPSVVDPFQVEKAWAVDELVEHPCGNVLWNGATGRCAGGRHAALGLVHRAATSVSRAQSASQDRMTHSPAQTVQSTIPRSIGFPTRRVILHRADGGLDLHLRDVCR